MRITALLVAIAGCGADDVQVEPDARAVDAMAIDAATDAPPLTEPDCTPPSNREPPPAQTNAAAGTYCATWEQQSGLVDAFPRYYDRADVELGATSSIRWYTSGSGGAKEYVQGAALDGAGCLIGEPFVGGGGVVGSDYVKLCWSDATIAQGTMAWCSGNLDAHWDVRLAACP